MGKLFTLEDAKASFNLFCCVYGIGTLGMPGNYARAGPVFATLALVFMASANVYASVVCSKVMLVAPKHVRTLGDVGEWSLGKTGRYLVVIAQMGVCLLVPCAFLVLGSIILDTLFPATFSDSVWIILMALSLLPICLTPTLKEGAAAALLGCLGTLAADFIALGILIYYLAPVETTPPHPAVTAESVFSTFGNLSLAYGAGIVIPALQRQHTDPKRMPRVIFFTLTLISILFMVIAVTGYALVGCQIPGNLLFAVGGTKLGFSTSKGSIFFSYVCMQIHITIAFAVILHPALYLGERMFLGMHKTVAPEAHAEEAKSYSNVITPNFTDNPDASVDQMKRQSQSSVVSMADIERTDESEYSDLAAYKTPAARVKSIVFRTLVVTLLVVISVLLRKHFLDLVDFVGASATSLSCIILPIVFYLKVFWSTIPIYEKGVGFIFVAVCSALGVYVSYTAGKNLFTTPEGGPIFPYCPSEYQMVVYNNQTHYDF